MAGIGERRRDFVYHRAATAEELLSPLAVTRRPPPSFPRRTTSRLSAQLKDIEEPAVPMQSEAKQRKFYSTTLLQDEEANCPSERGRCGLAEEMGGAFRLLRLLGLFPAAPGQGKGLGVGLGWAASVAALGACVLLGAFNMYVVNLMISFQGVLHVDTMTSILTGLKPFQAAVNIFIFSVGVSYHKEFLAQAAHVEQEFATHFQAIPPYRFYCWTLLLLSALTWLLPFLARLTQYILAAEIPGMAILSDFSLLIVPTVTVWQLAPLFYFIVTHAIVRFYFRVLEQALSKDIRLERFNINFYYRMYLDCTRLCGCGGSFWNPFIFLNIAFPVLIICLAVYFVTNAKAAFHLPETATWEEEVMVLFLPIWSGSQLFVAFLCILSIAYVGMRTNEESRTILAHVLALMPEEETGRFQVICFTNRIQNQFAWGVTAWRAFAIERGLLLTLASAISTYAVVLVKLKSNIRPELLADLNSTLPL